MEEEIDLRPYIGALIKYWYVIIGLGILAAIIVFSATSSFPSRYEAESLVVVVNARDVIDFDLRFREVNSPQPLRGYPELALSDDVLQIVLAQQIVPGIETTEELRKSLSAETGDDLSILRLQAVAQQPEDAALLATTWASSFTTWANDVFSNRSGEQLSYFESQLNEAQVELSAAEDALVEYQAINRTQIISNTLAAHMAAQVSLLNQQQQIDLLQQNVQHLHDQLTEGAASSPITLADQLTALSLQLAVFEADTAVPILQVDASSILTSENRTEQISLLESLLTTLATQENQLSHELATVEPLILELQQERQTATTQFNKLQRDQLVAEETYLALARKVEEERITSQDTSSGVTLASQAAVPVEPMSSGRLLFTAVAALFGLTIGSIVVISYTRLRNNHP